MFQPRNHAFNAALSIVILSIAVFAASCSKSSPSSNSSTSSTPTSASSSADFEGVIAMKMETEMQKGSEITYFLKGQHTRVEAKIGDNPENQAVLLWDLDGGKMTTLMPARKMYMITDLKAAEESMRGAAGIKKSPDEEEKFPKLTATGKQETIAGYTCEHWLMGDKQEMDICVAKGLGYFGMGGQSGGGSSVFQNLAFGPKLLAEAQAHPEWVKFLEGGAFPLKMTMTDEGKPRMTMEATKIERKSLDDSLFAIPADYKELNMGSLTGGRR